MIVHVTLGLSTIANCGVCKVIYSIKKWYQIKDHKQQNSVVLKLWLHARPPFRHNPNIIWVKSNKPGQAIVFLTTNLPEQRRL